VRQEGHGEGHGDVSRVSLSVGKRPHVLCETGETSPCPFLIVAAQFS
jgi:hypothetical protein